MAKILIEYQKHETLLQELLEKSIHTLVPLDPDLVHFYVQHALQL